MSIAIHFEEIGRQLSLTPEMVGQIEKAALRKLRQPSWSGNYRN